MVLAAGKMYRPTDIAADTTGNSVFVVEQFNHRVSKWDYTAGMFTFTLDTGWGSNDDGTSGEGSPIGDGGVSDNALYRPTGIAFDSTNSLLYVTDTFHNRVRVINSADGEFTTSLGVGGSASNEFYRPAGIAIDAADAVVVIADELNHRAVRYTTNGTTLVTPTVLTDPSVTSDLSFVRPHGVIFQENNGNFNIGDSLRGVISVYFVNGNFDSQYGTPGSAPANTNIFYPGSGEGLLGGTTGAIFADTRNNALKTTNAAVVALTTGATAGTGNGQLHSPESASAFVDTANYVLAANTLNNRVETYSSAASVLTSEDPFNFGSP